MKRNFADLHLRVNPNNQNTFENAINKAARLGYNAISIPFNIRIDESEIDRVRKSCKAAGLDFVSRVDFRPRNENELTHFLRKFRRRFEIITILCENKEVARQAARDRRVDLLNFPNLDYRKRFFDRAEAELASSSLAGLELDIKPLLILEGPPRVRLLMSLSREIAVAREFHVPIIISSGVEEERFMHMPKDLASLAYLIGMDEPAALDAVSTNPTTIVKRNREKLSAQFVAPGITILKEGKAVEKS